MTRTLTYRHDERPAQARVQRASGPDRKDSLRTDLGEVLSDVAESWGFLVCAALMIAGPAYAFAAALATVLG